METLLIKKHNSHKIKIATCLKKFCYIPVTMEIPMMLENLNLALKQEPKTLLTFSMKIACE